ncbi:PLD nuclease N-terminal domain-containing protein [Helcobacillus sp. ACRRO]|uniref:PLD nuclease N-terminal domain-containing protein n=1 Tax=Helcobacillus TaxID=1161125 RepID=UPI001EF64F78|nr:MULTISPECIES: PLD nuclease N-terminal domain-containing protein [Helcobacillus]MCG7427984.1 PLD nuclease N-terminal domain-containing protein [Helcobacillus sp. ACRRO]MDK7743019.1 PLD nuclease N-terminal domain-containing protein [Helcobacillus massiliensis]WOO92317.1 PLD nuclease N-terminal domain-containing protein [Helcobacillus massiliensis]
MLRPLIIIVTIALAIYALADCVQSEEREVKVMPKLVWAMFIVLIPWVGPITWFLAGKEGRALTGTGTSNGGNGPGRQNLSALGWGNRRRQRARTGPLAPDDDPEFLAKLDREIRAERRRRIEEQHRAAKQAELERRQQERGGSTAAERSPGDPQARGPQARGPHTDGPRAGDTPETGSTGDTPETGSTGDTPETGSTGDDPTH